MTPAAILTTIARLHPRFHVCGDVVTTRLGYAVEVEYVVEYPTFMKWFAEAGVEAIMFAWEPTEQGRVTITWIGGEE